FNSDCKTNKKINSSAEKYAVKIYNDISKMRSYPIKRIKQKSVITFGLKSFVFGKGEKYEAVKKRWRELDIIS
ncbi:MAG: hypothetical protein ACI4JF_05190, partial [Oscillospiraceae bacterium]